MYNSHIDGLLKGGNPQKAVEIFQRMKRDCCQPSTETYTLMINLYGKVSQILFSFIYASYWPYLFTEVCYFYKL